MVLDLFDNFVTAALLPLATFRTSGTVTDMDMAIRCRTITFTFPMSSTATSWPGLFHTLHDRLLHPFVVCSTRWTITLYSPLNSRICATLSRQTTQLPGTAPQTLWMWMSNVGSRTLVERRRHYCKYKDFMEEWWEILISMMIGKTLWVFEDSLGDTNGQLTERCHHSLRWLFYG